MIEVVKKPDFENIKKQLTGNSSGGGGPPIAKVVTRALEAIKREIQLRTQKGQGADGESFGSYSPAYAKYRQGKGRNTSPVSLEFTGQMFKAMQVAIKADASGIEGKIYFTPGRQGRATSGKRKGKLGGGRVPTNTEIARGHMNYGRNFFALSREQAQFLTDEISKAIKL
jgi:hypothetical protein